MGLSIFRKKVFFLLLILISFALFGCANEDKILIKEHQQGIYEIAVDVGYNKDFKTWVKEYYKDKFTVFDLKNIKRLGLFEDYISITYISSEGSTTSRVLSYLKDIIPSYNENNTEYIIDDNIIKWKLLNNTKWNELISLEKIAFPFEKPSYDIIFGNTSDYSINVAYQNPVNYVIIANLGSLISVRDFRRSIDIKEIELNKEIEIGGYTLIPIFDYGTFTPDESGYYLIKHSDQNARVGIRSKENNYSLQLGYGSINVYLQENEPYSIEFETISYSKHSIGNSTYKILIEKDR